MRDLQQLLCFVVRKTTNCNNRWRLGTPARLPTTFFEASWAWLEGLELSRGSLASPIDGFLVAWARLEALLGERYRAALKAF